MTICGYPCEDLWQKKYFVKAVEEKISEISKATQNSRCAILLGAPTIALNRGKKEIIQNSAILIEQGEIKKIIGKKNLPNFGVFDERRYFEPATSLSLIEFREMNLAILICEDLWDLKNLYLLQEQILDAVIAINASPYSKNKHQKRQKIAENFAKTLGKPLVYVNQIGGQDSLVFDGSSFVMNAEGKVALQMKEFAEDSAVIEIGNGPRNECGVTVGFSNEQTCHPALAAGSSEDSRNYSACVLGLRDYIQKNNFKKVLLGMSGGIDSALVAAIAVDALGSENVALYALPTRFNSETSMIDAKACAKNLGIDLQVIAIESVFESLKFALRQAQGDDNVMLSLSKHEDTTEENMQSRIRGNILMSLSNKFGGLLLSTGNKSELAVGYATIYGDMCGAFNPIKDLYKTEIYELVKWRNENIPEISTYKKTDLIPQNIITKAPTAELRLNQKDSDSLPEYEILDKILFALIEEEKSLSEIIKSGFEESLVKKVAKLFYASEYKRKQAVMGVKISDMSFDKDRRYPITNKFKS
jgi:NAD+ synthase